MIAIKSFVFLTVFSLNAAIIQTNSMEDILPHVDETAWVLFDIDDTLVESAVHAGRAEWFNHEVKQLMLIKGLDRHTADALLFPEWDAFMEICPIQTPEENTAELVKAIQQKSGAAFALTGRHAPVVKITMRQLAQLGFDFSYSAPPRVSLSTPHPTHWEEGVLFASMKNPKGTLFRQFLEKSENKPRKIIFIDDSKHHLEGMENALKASGVEFVGFHYTKSLERPFDPEIAANQYRTLQPNRGLIQ